MSDWIEQQDENDNVYYLNSVTGESSWTNPDAFVEIGGWIEQQDEHGNVYYLHTGTNATQWDRPSEMDTATSSPSFNATTETTSTTPVTTGKITSEETFENTTKKWVFYRDEQEDYYYNILTGDCVRDKPLDFDGDETGEAVLPDELAAKMKKAFEGKLKKVDADTQKKIKEIRKDHERIASQSTITWVAVYDPTADAFYYYDPATGKTIWDQPTDFIESADDETMAAVIKIQGLYRSKKARQEVEKRRRLLEEKKAAEIKKKEEEANFKADAKRRVEAEVEAKRLELKQHEETLAESATEKQQRQLEEARKRMHNLSEEEDKIKKEMEELQRKKEEKKRAKIKQQQEEEEQRKREAEEEEKKKAAAEREQERLRLEKEREERLEMKRMEELESLKRKKQELEELEKKRMELENRKRQSLEEEKKRRQEERLERERQRKERRLLEEQNKKSELQRFRDIYQEGLDRYYEAMKELKEHQDESERYRQSAIDERKHQKEHSNELHHASVINDCWDCMNSSVSFMHLKSTIERLLSEGLESDIMKWKQTSIRDRYDAFIKRAGRVELRVKEAESRLQSVKNNISKNEDDLKAMHATEMEDPLEKKDRIEALENILGATKVTLAEAEVYLVQQQREHKKCIKSIEYLSIAVDETGKNNNASAKKRQMAETQQKLVQFHRENGDTLLHTACWHGDIEKVQYLLSLGSDVNQRDSSVNKFTPLHEATRRGNLEIVLLLLDAGAKVEAQDFSGETSLHIACRKSFVGIVRSLLKADTQMITFSKKNNRGKTPFMLTTHTTTKHVMQQYLLRMEQMEAERLKDQQKKELHEKTYRSKQKNGMVALRRHLQGLRSMDIAA